MHVGAHIHAYTSAHAHVYTPTPATMKKDGFDKNEFYLRPVRLKRDFNMFFYIHLLKILKLCDNVYTVKNRQQRNA